jgi:hypothetical protein
VSCVVQFFPLYVGQLNRSTGNAFFSMTSWVQAQEFSCELVHVRIFPCRRATKSSKLWCKGSLLYRVSKGFRVERCSHLVSSLFAISSPRAKFCLTPADLFVFRAYLRLVAVLIPIFKNGEPNLILCCDYSLSTAG